MVAHVPTLLVMIITSSLMMATCMAVVGWGRRRDGLGRWATALLINAGGHLLLLLRGQIPDLVSILGGNLMLSAVLAGMIAAIYQFQGRSASWPLLLAPTVLVLALALLFRHDFQTRVGVVGLVIGVQAVWALATALERRHATVGRGLSLLVAGLLLEGVVVLGRSVVIINGGLRDLGVLDSSWVQTVTYLATFSVVLVSSMGFVFMLRERADEQNRVLAALDPLTGIANRRSLITALDRDVGRALRTRESIALMMVDIDHFKDINDQYGHPVGDVVLRHVVRVLCERVRAQDLVGRYGGEEFMVVLPDTELDGAVHLARQLCEALATSRCRVRGVEGASDGLAVTASIGVYGGRLEPGDNWDMLIAAADRALYQAKKNGRNRVEVAAALRRHGPSTSPGSLPGTL